MPVKRVSVVIRTKDEAEHLGGVLTAVAAQTTGPAMTEVIVVDSGSSDGTLEIARGHGTQLIEIPPESFSYGRALNIGCEAATAPVVVALSGHAYPPDDGWLDRMLVHFEDEQVACVGGAAAGPTGERLDRPIRQDATLAEDYPHWGYSNAAGGFRRKLWRVRPFREDMPYTEDKEWAWHWLHAGKVAVLDPTLTPIHDHTRDPVLTCYLRGRAAWQGYSMFLDLPPLTLGEVIRRARGTPDRRRRAILPGTWAGLLGQYVARRAATRRSRAAEGLAMRSEP